MPRRHFSSASRPLSFAATIFAAIRRTTGRPAGDRLISGWVGIWAARARQSQPARGPAQGRDEAHPEQPRQASPAVPPVHADRSGRGNEPGNLRRRGRLPLYAHSKTGAPGMAGQDSRHRFTSDGTARVQTVSEDPHRVRLNCLPEEFEALHGVPVSPPNTSFNVKGEPIVETPVICHDLLFMTTGIETTGAARYADLKERAP